MYVKKRNLNKIEFDKNEAKQTDKMFVRLISIICKHKTE